MTSSKKDRHELYVMMMHKDEINQSLPCQRHPSQMVIFVCISHSNCEYRNLFCIDCVDEQSKMDPHQLLSLRRFLKFVRYYNQKAKISIDQVHYTLCKVREKINNELDILESTSIAMLNSDLPLTSLDSEFRQCLIPLAQRQIWSKINEVKQNEGDFQKSIFNQINNYSQPIFNLIGRILHAFEESARVAQDTSDTTDKINNKLIDSDDPSRRNTSASEDRIDDNNLANQENLQNLQNSINHKQRMHKNKVVKNRRGKKGSKKYSKHMKNKRKLIQNKRQIKERRQGSRKKYTEEQKLKIINKIGKTITKCKIAQDYNIAYSTLRKWELKFLSSEKFGKELHQFQLSKRRLRGGGKSHFSGFHHKSNHQKLKQEKP